VKHTSTDTTLALNTSRDDFDEPSMFLPENLLREARRQRARPSELVPAICLLDPDGDVLRFLQERQGVVQLSGWACYHTDLWVATFQGLQLGVIGCAVGAPFAVLVAEELFASGCELLVSVTSAGRLVDHLPESCMVLVDQAIRGEGASQAYLPSAQFACAEPELVDSVYLALEHATFPVVRGTVWTTDAPFRETASALNAAREAGALAVEMEAAALYAFARARHRDVVCFAHVTNGMAVQEGDFEKGPSDGALQALEAVRMTVAGWQARTGAAGR